MGKKVCNILKIAEIIYVCIPISGIGRYFIIGRRQYQLCARAIVYPRTLLKHIQNKGGSYTPLPIIEHNTFVNY